MDISFVCSEVVPSSDDRFDKGLQHLHKVPSVSLLSIGISDLSENEQFGVCCQCTRVSVLYFSFVSDFY